MLQKLFEPATFFNVPLKNRIVFPATGTHVVNEDGTVSQRQTDFLVRIAQGGVGMIVVEYCEIDPVQHSSTRPLNIYEDRFIEGLSRLVCSLKPYGVAVAVQLHHPGRMSDARISGVEGVAPSAIPSKIMRETPRELTDAEIWFIVEEFAEGIRRAKLAGFDAVELHGGTGYLIQQFFSPLSNKRQDDWGGDTERRSKFTCEIIKRAKEKVGKEYPIILRLAVDDFIDGGLGIEESKRIVPIIESVGLDCISVTAGTFDSPGHKFSAIAPVMFQPPGCHADLAAAIKQVAKTPVMVAGRINTPQLAERILEQNKSDLICICRPLIADPDFPNKAREGRYREIRRCIFCNTCGDVATQHIPGGELLCVINPNIGREGTPETKADLLKKVMVLGGGPAGLEVARVASIRGHSVALLDENAKLGGRWSWLIKPYISNRLKDLRELGVDLRFGATINREFIKQWAPDVVVAIKRLKALSPEIPGLEKTKWCTADDVFASKCHVKGSVVVIGGNNIGLEVADFLVRQDKDITVTVVEEGWIGRGIGRLLRGELLARMSDQGVSFCSHVKINKVMENSVVLLDAVQGEHSLVFDWLVVAKPAEIDDVPPDYLVGQPFEVIWINPIQSPRDWPYAFMEGTTVARSI